jgi:hypothetical protein
LGFRGGRRLHRRPGIDREQGLMSEGDAQLVRHVIINGAGMRLLVGHADFGQLIKDFVRLDFELPCQLVNTNLLHR